MLKVNLADFNAAMKRYKQVVTPMDSVEDDSPYPYVFLNYIDGALYMVGGDEDSTLYIDCPAICDQSFSAFLDPYEVTNILKKCSGDDISLTKTNDQLNIECDYVLYPITSYDVKEFKFLPIEDHQGISYLNSDDLFPFLRSVIPVAEKTGTVNIKTLSGGLECSAGNDDRVVFSSGGWAKNGERAINPTVLSVGHFKRLATMFTKGASETMEVQFGYNNVHFIREQFIYVVKRASKEFNDLTKKMPHRWDNDYTLGIPRSALHEIKACPTELIEIYHEGDGYTHINGKKFKCKGNLHAPLKIEVNKNHLVEAFRGHKDLQAHVLKKPGADRVVLYGTDGYITMLKNHKVLALV